MLLANAEESAEIEGARVPAESEDSRSAQTDRVASRIACAAEAIEPRREERTRR